MSSSSYYQSGIPHLLNQQDVSMAQNQHLVSLPSLPRAHAPDDSRKRTLPLFRAVQRSKQRVRVNTACDRCRTQKVKCSGEQPCGTCARLGKVCEFNPVGVVLPPIRSETSPASITPNPGTVGTPATAAYVLELETKVKYLESLLLKQSPRQASNSDDVRVDDTCYLYSKNKWRLHRRYQNVLTNKLGAELFKQLSPESQAGVIPPRVQFYGWNMSGLHYLKQTSLPAFTDLIRDRTVERELLDYFFREINLLFAIVHESVFREQYAKYVADSGDARASNQTRLFAAILYLIFPLAMRFHEFQLADQPSPYRAGLEEALFEAGFAVIQKLSFEWESFELIQSWFLIFVYLRVLHRQTSLIHALGNAVSMSRSMSINYRLSSRKPYNNMKARRIFWCIYTWDKLNGLQSGRHYTFKDDWDIHLEFPTMDFERENDGWLTWPALAMCHLAQIAGHIQTFKSASLSYTEVQALSLDLQLWHDTYAIRDDTLFDDPSGIAPAVRAQVKLHYYDVVIQLHIRKLFNYVGMSVACPGLSVEHLLTACAGSMDIFAVLEANGALTVPWFLTMLLLFQIGIVSIILINAGLHLPQCNSNLSEVIRVMTRLRGAANDGAVPKYRFEMTSECLWALKMLNHMVCLRLQESIHQLKYIGIDHGSDEVNSARFSQFEVLQRVDAHKSVPDRMLFDSNDQSEGLQAEGPSFAYSNERANGDRSVTPYDPDEVSRQLSGALDSLIKGEGKDFAADSLFGNLQWFDQTPWNFEFNND
ncbi:hypothetical protein BABINDRAFT_159912 [Babjeviella inositovora NRRL Y-12698]|uniref:Zn(2)-C6 fungal-type domain-containing protein n=1 Tax=Babjeviella inositovora NRRL Y-12698 TaxID=984486 RepID=A0A1E3QVG1_9ASCO|nr:uncharacterized protein BABINDRAFT_159912 [Babjeviella inositovora NRRL Y-12698]ODQ81651.1 hypothetical protein BABINDRAFT_159912 [Babjeviella inositovora NRRL Y-12698]